MTQARADRAAPASHGKARGKRPAVSRRTVLGLAAAAAAGAAGAGWKLSRGAALPRGGTRLWSRPVPAGSSQAGSPVVQSVSDGIVYLSTEPGQYALSVATGAELWNSRSLTFVGLAGRGAVCATGPDGLYRVGAADGRTLWHSAFEARKGSFESDGFSVLHGTLVYGVDVRGGIHAVDTRSGATTWRFSANRQPMGFAVAGDVAYLLGSPLGSDSFSQTYLYAARAGKEVWHRQFPASTAGLTVAGNRCYLLGGTTDLELEVLRAADGVRSWTFPLGGQSEPTVITDDIAYCSRDGAVHALSADDGSKLWQFSTGRTIVSLERAADRDTLYVSTDLAVYALNATRGHQMWRFTTSGSAATVLPAGDTVYVAGNDLHAVSAADGRQRWAFPVEAAVSGPGMLDTSVTVGLAAARGVAYFAGTDSRVYAVSA